ncbi:xylosidase : arabinofuranosidase [Aspergillus steynii IBT 23096]|uniref:Xylosidase: arabinofuranosidase n=1 Tax=Aspergillus steynii IBT 23096 TaxID=1392250 RepID=A0A2I2GIP7_9EURO|nr:xylosidase : arabinofuranosidase [Aspergillus steynii IBT 23096]PLB52738.1 xylosidase : arabinofuranosidase [Aspergillus steynii IBT 23096]
MFIITILQAILLVAHAVAAQNSTFSNPILSGFHPDPSCVFVEELDNTFFCVTSTFLAFPGVPVYASRDLKNWKLISHVFNRPSQYPGLGTKRTFINLVFSSTDLFDDDAWSDPVEIDMHGINAIDPDLFWDDDGQVYMLTGWGKIYQSAVDLETGGSSKPVNVWNGTGAESPEGPHMYKKNGYYYLLIAQGGTGINHSVAIARSAHVSGPFEGFSGNPLLTAKNTENFFQCVGHADLFQDANKKWWGVALATRSGPDHRFYPMGRETVLYPVTWDDEWPVLDPVYGHMEGWEKPGRIQQSSSSHKSTPDVDSVDFEPGSSIPRHWKFWRFPDPSSYTISPPKHPNSLELSPSKSNLTGILTEAHPINCISRRQTASLFNFSVDIDFSPTEAGEEAGVSVFITQLQHIDLSIQLASNGSQVLRLQTTAYGKPDAEPPKSNTLTMPRSWIGEILRMYIEAKEPTAYSFSAARASEPLDVRYLGNVSAEYVTGGSGSYTGTLLSAYNTNNNRTGKAKAWISRWRYLPLAQEVERGVFEPVNTN